MEDKEAYNANSYSYSNSYDQVSERVPIKNTPYSSQNSPAMTVPIDGRDDDRKDDTPFSDLNEKTVKPSDIDVKAIDSSQVPRISIEGNSKLPAPVSDQLDCQINKPGHRKRGLPRPESKLRPETAK